MREYGGYIELDTYRLPMLHKGAIALNCGRNCLAYLFGTRKIRKLKLPYYMCDSVFNLCRKYGVEMSFYHVNDSFYPEDIKLSDDEWLYVMNYYGQLERGQLGKIKTKYKKVIIDNAQAYFDEPLEDTDTLYTCRKFFGVPDGAFLYTDSISEEEYPTDESFERMRFLLGRYERNASEFYQEYSANDHMFADEPILKISKLTNNLLHGIDYEFVKQRRTENFETYSNQLNVMNKLKLRVPKGAFAYPLLVEKGSELRKALQQRKIYISLLWPNVVSDGGADSFERFAAENILPLPCDQRYSKEDINYIIQEIGNYV